MIDEVETDLKYDGRDLGGGKTNRWMSRFQSVFDGDQSDQIASY